MAKSVLAVVMVSQLFYQVTENLDTQRYLHQTRRILSPPHAKSIYPSHLATPRRTNDWPSS